MNEFLPPVDPKSLPGDFISPGGLYIIEDTGAAGAAEAAEAAEAKRHPRTANSLLHFMISRREVYGSPLPEGFVPPPGIDIQELLKRLPPVRPRPSAE